MNVNVKLTGPAVIYRRKSSEDEDRQVASLLQQKQELEEHVIARQSLSILENFEESRSAKKPGRQDFNRMCEILKTGQARYIVCWALNRLARNPVDGGRILWLVQNYGVKIVTPSKTYDENDVMLMHVEFAMSNQFILDLRKNSNRGVEYKIKAGIAPILAPIGYKNEKYKRQGEKDISIDPDRFFQVRKMWDLVLTGNYSVTTILSIATDEWGLRRSNGKPLSRSQVYDVLTNIFYTGQFVYAGKTYQGIHEQMITLDEFDRAQRILGSRGRPRQQSHNFAYTGLIQCKCGSRITAHERFRKICTKCHHKFNAQSNDKCPRCGENAPDKTWYGCLYHCTKSADASCTQPSINLKEMENQFEESVKNVKVPKALIQWGIRQLRKENETENQDRITIVKNLTGALNVAEKKETTLKNKFFGPSNENEELLSESEYMEMRGRIRDEKKMLQKQLELNSNVHEVWLEEFEKAFNFTKSAQDKLKYGTLEERRIVISTLGLNLTLDNRKVRIDLKKEYAAMEKGKKIAEEIEKAIEPEVLSVDSIQKAYDSGRFPILGRSPRVISPTLMQSVNRILAVFDDVVQFGLVSLRVKEIRSLYKPNVCAISRF